MAIKIAGTEVINDNKRVLNNESLPDVRPSLLLDFANSKTLDPRITFTRGSTATYWDGKTTTKAEENLQGGSSLFNTTYWLFAQCTFTADYTTAPDGTSTAVRLIEDSSPNYHYLHGQTSNTVSTTSGTTYTWSIYAKKGAGTSAPDIVQLCFRGNTHSTAYANFNISTGAVTGSADVVSSSITSVGNGWYRLVVTATANSSGSGGGGVFSFTNNGPSATRLPIYTGNTNADVLLWGPQFEQRSSATAYTPTTSSPIVKYQPTLQTAASGEARFDHDPVTGESKGLLIEEDRTNVITYSEDITDSSWNNEAAILYSNVGVAPDGTQTADLVTGTTADQQHNVYKSVSLTSGTTYSMSVFAKAGGYDYCYLQENHSNSGAPSRTWFDLSDGTIGTTDSDHTATIEDVGNGWYRCSVTFTPAATGAQLCSMRISNADNTSSFAADGGYKGVFQWGFQLEAGAFPTSYIPTSGSTVTRSTDSAVVEGTAFTDAWRDDEVTVYASGTANTNRASNTNLLTITSTASNVNNRAGWSFRTGTGSDEMLIDNFYAYGSAPSDYADDAYPYAKVAYRFKNSDFAWTVNYPDNPLFTDSVTTGYGPAKNKLYIGATYNGGAKSTTIEKIAFYPVGLSNATLQAMTEE